MNPAHKTLQGHVGEKLRTWRKKKKLTLPQMAQASGVGARTLSDYEKGIRLPGGENLAKLAQFFKMTPAGILK